MCELNLDAFLREYFDNDEFEPVLKECILYALLPGGKRLRPNLMIEAYKANGGQMNDDIMRVVAAIECIHCYTLIHDDLPCMDDDDVRRGKPSCHKKFGEPTALLAGDALLNAAYELLFLASAKLGHAKAFYNFAKLCGGAGIVGGQSLELNSKKLKDDLKEVYRKKTCNLIWGSMYMGASLANADKVVLDAYKKYSYYYGMLFQLCDDLDDIKGSEISFASVYGEEKTKKDIALFTKKAVESLVMSGINNEYFVKLALTTGKAE